MLWISLQVVIVSLCSSIWCRTVGMQWFKKKTLYFCLFCHVKFFKAVQKLLIELQNASLLLLKVVIYQCLGHGHYNWSPLYHEIYSFQCLHWWFKTETSMGHTYIAKVKEEASSGCFFWVLCTVGYIRIYVFSYCCLLGLSVSVDWVTPGVGIWIQWQDGPQRGETGEEIEGEREDCADSCVNFSNCKWHQDIVVFASLIKFSAVSLQSQTLSM